MDCQASSQTRARSSAASAPRQPSRRPPPCKGCLWALKVDRGTWFGEKAEYTFGIQIMPLTPITEILVRPSWINASRAAWSAINDATDQWKAFIIIAASTLDPDKAWRDAQALTAFDDGMTKTNLLYWLATRGKVRVRVS